MGQSKPIVKTKRVYAAAEPDDGLRVLVDRLWPRGLRKSDAEIDLWLKDAAPSADLRRWYAHEPQRWEDFKQRYVEELETRPNALKTLAARAENGPVTLLHAARDVEHNNAVVLKELLETHDLAETAMTENRERR